MTRLCSFGVRDGGSDVDASAPCLRKADALLYGRLDRFDPVRMDFPHRGRAPLREARDRPAEPPARQRRLRRHGRIDGPRRAPRPGADARVLDRFTDVCSEVIERHGGSVEGFIGDAVVGVFGQTELHEDDAMRAVRSAVELRDAGAALSAELQRDKGVSIGMKVGVESGQVFVSPGARRSLVRRRRRVQRRRADRGPRVRGRDPARRQHVLHGAGRRARRVPRADGGQRAGREGPRVAPARSWRRDGLVSPEPGRSRFVGRAAELDELRAAFSRVREEGACRAITVVGPAGIGKTRLAREFVAELGDEAKVVVGRCLSYGEDVAYRPLAEIVRQLGDGEPRERGRGAARGRERDRGARARRHRPVRRGGTGGGDVPRRTPAPRAGRARAPARRRGRGHPLG